MNPRSVLAISVARIGDTLLLTPSLKAIKASFPGAELTVLAHPKRQEVLEHLGVIDHLGSITKAQAPWRGWLPGKKYDVALVHGRDMALVCYALRVSRRVVCFDEPEFAALHDQALTRVPLPASPMHAVLHRMLLLQPLGIATAADLRLSMQFTDSEMQEARDRLATLGLQGKHPLVGMQPFSFPTKAHRDWPVEHFAEFIEAVHAKLPGARFLVLGDGLAAQRSAGLVARFPGTVQVIAGQLSLRQSAALMRLLDLYLGVDTGPTHIAGALGIPMVAMYHWRYPAAYLRPLMNENCIAIEHPATSDHETGCSEGMAAIAVDRVVKAAVELIERWR